MTLFHLLEVVSAEIQVPGVEAGVCFKYMVDFLVYRDVFAHFLKCFVVRPKLEIVAFILVGVTHVIEYVDSDWKR